MTPGPSPLLDGRVRDVPGRVELVLNAIDVLRTDVHVVVPDPHDDVSTTGDLVVDLAPGLGTLSRIGESASLVHVGVDLGIVQLRVVDVPRRDDVLAVEGR